jgi:hypothetical protein
LPIEVPHESTMRVLRPACVAVVAPMVELIDEPAPHTKPVSSLQTATPAVRRALYCAISTS